MPVNSTTWRKLPMAPRETAFNADDALARIKQWSAGSVEKLASAFFWHAPNASGDLNGYRLPMGDISNGKLILVPRAVFTAAAILSGAHGGLEGVVGEDEKNQLKRVITKIYDVFREQWGDRRQIPPWLRGGNEEGKVVASAVNQTDWALMPVAPSSRPWNGDAARAALWAWADGDVRKYRKGFLWWDATKPDVQGSYKLPVALPVDGALTLVPSAVRAIADVLASAPSSVDVPEADMGSIQAAIDSIQSRFDHFSDGGDEALSAAFTVGGQESPLVFPPSSWFTDPKFQGPTPLAVTADGEVLGHIALWNQCHAGIGDRCVMAPKSAKDYQFFKNGTVLTADGQTVKVGKITMGTGHADKHFGYVPAADHYDNTGTVASIGNVGEDRFGIWYHGAVVPEADPAEVQQLRRSPISGDWRRINGNLELVAALAVNTPGFPIVSMTASGEIDSLCAAGVLLEDGTVVADASVPLSEPDKEILAALSDLEKQWDKIRQNMRTNQLRTLLKKDVR